MFSDTAHIIADIIAMPANKNPIGIRKNGSDRVPSGKTSEPTTLNIVKHAILATTKRILNKYFFIFNFVFFIGEGLFIKLASHNHFCSKEVFII